MFWKIVGALVLVWIALAVVGAVLENLFGFIVLGALIFGGYLLYKAMSGKDEHSDARGI